MIRLNRDWWDGAWKHEGLRMSAARAEEDLRLCGHDVCVVDGGDATPCTADTDAEREAVESYYAEMKETWNVGVHCGTLLMWQAEQDAAAQPSSPGWPETMKQLPPESQERVKDVLRKLLRAPRSNGRPPLAPRPPAAESDESK